MGLSVRKSRRDAFESRPGAYGSLKIQVDGFLTSEIIVITCCVRPYRLRPSSKVQALYRISTVVAVGGCSSNGGVLL